MNAARFRFAWLPRAVVSLAHALAAAPALLPAAVQAQAAAAPAEEAPRFDVFEFVVEGNTVLPVPAIEQAITPFLGPRRTMADVESARAALEKVYQGAGYLSVFVDIPEQRLGPDGVVTLQVLEGRIERLSVSGSRYFSQGYIRSKVAEFAEGRVPNFNEAQRQLALVNRSEERRVQPVLRPGRVPGTVQVDLQVSDELPLEGSIELNNQHPADTKPWRLAGSVRYDNLFQRDHSLAINLQTAPQQPSQSQVGVLNYAIPLDSGHSVSAYAVYSDSAVQTLGGITALGNGITLGLRYAIPFFAGQSAHSVTFGVDYKDLKQQLVTAGAGDPATSTPLRYLPVQVAYNGSWAEAGSQGQLALTFIGAARRILQREVPDCPRADGSFGPADQFACNHRGADGGFGLLRGDLKLTEPLWGGHQLTLRLAGQFAPQPLVSGEQFAAGGADSVRGYLESSANGDLALLGSVQWRSPRFGAWFGDAAASRADAAAGPWWGDLSAIAFLDAARVTTLEPAAGQDSRVPLLGSGVGLRLEGRGRVNAGIDLAWPQKATANQASGPLRVHARLSLRF